MMESNELITQQKFESMYPSDHSWFQWVVNKSKSWILPASTSHSLIVLVTVKAIAKSILDQFYQKPLTSWLDTLFTFHEFKARYGTFNGKALSDSDVWLVLRYLGYKMGLGVVESIELYGTAFMVSVSFHCCVVYYIYMHISLYQAIKFPDRVETAAQKPVELSENDKAVIGLKTTRVALLGRIDELQAKSDE